MIVCFGFTKYLFKLDPCPDDVFVFTFRYFDYLFYVDFEASMADQQAQNALRNLKVHSV